jgi:hypothetical protein
VIPSLERRLRQQRSRVAVRSWDYRQRHHARGVWFRLRRILADAQAAFAIPCDEAAKLIAEGYPAEPVGRELEPPKVLFFVPANRVAQIGSAQRLAVRLGADLLGAECIALTPFETRP